MENDRIIEIEIDLKEEDYQVALLWYNQTKIILAAIVLLLAILGTGLIASREADVIAAILFFLSIFILLVFIVSAFIGIWQKSKKLAEYSEKGQVTFDENGLESKTETTSFQTAWERITKICETKTDFIFFPQEDIFYPIPKRFFQSENQINVFKSLIQDKLGEKAKLKS